MLLQKEKLYASFVLYYDEEINLNRTIFNQIETWISSKFEYFEIIIVNNSKLSLSMLKQELTPSTKEIMVIDLGEKHLQDHALRAGIEFSKGDSVFIIFDYHIKNITEQLQLIYDAHNFGNDIVILNCDYSKLRHKLLLKMISKLSDENMSLKHDFMFLISKRVVNYYTLTKSKILPLHILLKDSGYKIEQIAYKTDTKIELSKDEYTLHMMMFSDMLPRLSFFISLVCFVTSFLGIIYVILLYLFNQSIMEGWTSLFLFNSFGFSGIFMILSFITRYLGLFGKEVLNKPIYKSKQITKL